MKISYKVLQKYISNLGDVEKLAQDLIMHTAEVEEIIYEWEKLKDVFIWEVKTCEKHPNSDNLNCTTVEVNWDSLKIVCGAQNVKVWQKVAVAVVWAKLKDDFVISKVKIRWEESEWMICSEDELWLVKERQEWILELPKDAPLWMNFAKYIGQNDIFLEVDNKAINHRPDMFSHIWVAREVAAIRWNKLNYEYSKRDFTNLNDLWVIVEDTNAINRYKCIKIENVSNIESPDYIKHVLTSASVASKWLLIDISNYSLYLYWQPIHCFDADKVDWNVIVRFAKNWESFVALDDKEYKLSSEDIVIADEKKILWLWWIIGSKSSAVSDSTKNILVESAHFNQSMLRKTWKRLWIRTDALNVYEKDITNFIQDAWAALVVNELEKFFPDMKIVSHSDIYPIKQKEIRIEFDLDFINKLIWKAFLEDEVLKILDNLWIKKEWDVLIIPLWRKDLNYIADIAEEIARITWYDKIEATLPKLESWAITQSNTYKIKEATKNFFVNIGYFDLFTYSFVNKDLMEKCLSNTENLVPMKNPLSEELTHLRNSLIPNMMLSLERNKENYEELNLFEIEKVFDYIKWEVTEYYSLSWVKNFKENIAYYKIQNTISNYLRNVWVYSFHYDIPKEIPSFAHPSRTANIIVRGKSIWTIWEIHPKVSANFSIEDRIGFFDINIDLLNEALFQTIKAKDISNFQENNFDLNFVINKDTKAHSIKEAISKTNNYIQKVDIIDIYEDEEKLKWKRSITFKIYIQSMEKTLDDKDKAIIINEIVNKVEKLGWELRS